jgi:hypothetical protein
MEWQLASVGDIQTRSILILCDTEGLTMTVLQATRPKASSSSIRSARLFLLELNGDRIHSMNPVASDRKTIVTNFHLTDGIVVDAEAGHIYWTNMGVPNLDDGSIEGADLDGGNLSPDHGLYLFTRTCRNPAPSQPVFNFGVSPTGSSPPTASGVMQRACGT